MFVDEELVIDEKPIKLKLNLGMPPVKVPPKNTKKIPKKPLKTVIRQTARSKGSSVNWPQGKRQPLQVLNVA